MCHVCVVGYINYVAFHINLLSVMSHTLKMHWEEVYQTKSFEEVSWFQWLPATSIELLEKLHLPRSAKIIDIGAGESRLADYLLAQGYEDLTLVDISEAAIQKTKTRLNHNNTVKFITADAGTFNAIEKYDFWHDRATFHFLTDPSARQHYIENLSKSLNPGAYVLMATFAEDGPKKCSGLDICRYSADELVALFDDFLKPLRCFKIEHFTPFDTLQRFTFCLFQCK